MLRRLLPWMLFPALILLAFGRSLVQDFSPNDDLFLIVSNLAIRGITFANAKTVFTTFDPELYIPLTFLTYQIEYSIGGLHPVIFHITNLLLHAANAILVALLLRMWTGNQRISWLVALLFAVHPLHTETVVWLSARKDLLSTFFALLTLLLYPRASSIGAYTLALLSKVSVVTLPIVLLILPPRRGQDLSRPHAPLKVLTPLLPFFVLSLVFGAIALLGKEQIVSRLTPLETLLMAGKSTTFYVQKLIFPVGLSPIYPYHGDITLVSPDFLLPLIFLFFLLSLFCFSLWKRWHSVAFGLGFFFLTLAPSFVNFNKAGFLFFAVDRYAYLPSVGLLFLMAVFLREASKRWGQKILTVIPLLLIIFIGLSMRQTSVWDTPETLYGRVLGLYPESVAARVSLAKIARETGKYEEAFELLREGLRYGDHIELHLHAGYIYARVGKVQDAREQFEVARGMDAKNPEPLLALGTLAQYEHRLEEAQALYEEAISLDSSYVAARVELAKLLIRRGDPERARSELEIALDWNPNFVEAHVVLAELLSALGEEELAENHREIAEDLQIGSTRKILEKP